ncbi:hypothetical protein [Pseudomonas sp. D(2018)]|uniref:hypothetical protein n=1 Tax=Pseudomonas sp. D(2018) TaxID=2502238 RepID=UPI0010F4D240|nr:hypothetical protein [Pseudomonas sp. D(2018)]
MNNAQRLFVEWSLWMTLWLVGVGWAVVLVWGIEAPFLTDHPFHTFAQEVLALDRAILVEAAKLMGVLVWAWLCLFVRVGRKK